jgi:hypothetical protein
MTVIRHWLANICMVFRSHIRISVAFEQENAADVLESSVEQHRMIIGGIMRAMDRRDGVNSGSSSNITIERDIIAKDLFFYTGALIAAM